MRKKISVRDLPEFDISEQLKDDDDIAAYLTMVINEGDLAKMCLVSWHETRQSEPKIPSRLIASNMLSMMTTEC